MQVLDWREGRPMRSHNAGERAAGVGRLQEEPATRTEQLTRAADERSRIRDVLDDRDHAHRVVRPRGKRRAVYVSLIHAAGQDALRQRDGLGLELETKRVDPARDENPDQLS